MIRCLLPGWNETPNTRAPKPISIAKSGRTARLVKERNFWKARFLRSHLLARPTTFLNSWSVTRSLRVRWAPNLSTYAPCRTLEANYEKSDVSNCIKHRLRWVHVQPLCCVSRQICIFINRVFNLHVNIGIDVLTEFTLSQIVQIVLGTVEDLRMHQVIRNQQGIFLREIKSTQKIKEDSFPDIAVLDTTRASMCKTVPLGKFARYDTLIHSLSSLGILRTSM